MSLLAGRLVVGAGVGLVSHTVPLYISECSHKDQVISQFSQYLNILKTVSKVPRQSTPLNYTYSL